MMVPTLVRQLKKWCLETLPAPLLRLGHPAHLNTVILAMKKSDEYEHFTGHDGLHWVDLYEVTTYDNTTLNVRRTVKKRELPSSLAREDRIEDEQIAVDFAREYPDE